MKNNREKREKEKNRNGKKIGEKKREVNKERKKNINK